VMKAVGNHLVLTFCIIRPQVNELFSIVLSRKPMQLTVDVSPFYEIRYFFKNFK
jgi:hypothetical protein